MATVASAVVQLIPSARGFGGKIQSEIGGDVDKVGKKSGKRLGGAMTAGIAGGAARMFAPIAAGMAVLGAGSFLSGAISSASDLSESGSKVGVVFGKSAAQIVAASKTSATSMGLTEGAYLSANGTLGNLMVSLGVAPKAAAGMSQEMVALASDMASFNNVPIEDALAAIQSGLTGETEPLKAFGVNMNDATLKAQALKMGLIKTTKEAMSPQTKALAAQKLIMAQTGTAQGDFARTSGGLANQQKILGAQFADVKTKVGGLLLPVVTKVVTFFNASIPKIAKFGEALRAGFSGDTASFSGLLGFVSQIGDKLGALSAFVTSTIVPAVQGFFASFQSGGGPSAISASFAGLVAFFRGQVVPAVMGIVTAIRGFVTVALPIVQAFVAGMMARIRPMLPTIRAIFAQIGAVITGILGLIGAVISRYAAIYRTIITNVTTVMAYVWKRWGSSLMNFAAAVFSKILTVIKAALGVIQGIIKTVTSVIKGDWSGAWAGIKQILSSAWSLIKSIISTGLTVIKGLLRGAWALIKVGVSAAWNGIKSLISKAWDGIKAAVTSRATALVGYIQGLPGRFAAGLASLGGLLAGKGREAMSSLQSAISTGAGAAVTFVGGIPGRIVAGIGNLGSLLISAGADLLRGLASGIRGAVGEVVASATAAAQSAVDAVKAKLRIGSPSKVMIAVGKFVGQGLAIGMKGTTSQVAAAAGKLATSVAAVFTDKIRSKDSALILHWRGEVARLGPLVKKHKSLADNLVRARKHLTDALAHKAKAADFGAAAAKVTMRNLSAQTNALTALARTRERVAVRLKAAQDRLADALKVRNDFARGVKASVVAFGSVVGVDPVEGAALTGGDIVAQLKERLAAATKFTAAMAKLKKLGLNKTAYQQLVEAGVEGGSASATALLAGGKGTIGTVNSLQAQLAKQGTKLGSAASRTLFQAGVDSAQGLVKGLASQGKALAASATRLAKGLVAAVKRALGIRSPSKVMASSVGRFIPLGVIDGIESERSALDKSMTSLVKVPRAGSLDFASSSARSQAVNGIDYDRLAQAMTKVQLAASISPERIDAAMGANLR